MYKTPKNIKSYLKITKKHNDKQMKLIQSNNFQTNKINECVNNTKRTGK